MYVLYQVELCSKYDREHDFDVMLGYIVICRKLRWICHKHSNNVVRQVETPGEATLLSCRIVITFMSHYLQHYFHVAMEVTL